MIMEVPQDKLIETQQIVAEWLHKERTAKKQLWSILGKLLHVVKRVRNARLFIERMLDTHRKASEWGYVALVMEFSRYLLYFRKFLTSYYGLNMIALPELQSDCEISLDACLSGCGGICIIHKVKLYYHDVFPVAILDKDHHISRLELLNIMLACKLFYKYWSNKTVRISCDNSFAVAVLCTGKSQNSFMMACTREIWLWAANYEFLLIPENVPVSDNRILIPDGLSRIHLSPKFGVRCDQVTKDVCSQRVSVKG